MKEVLASLAFALLLITGFYENSNNKQSDFEKWQNLYGKFSNENERIYRENIYNQNRKIIEDHNNDETQTYKMGENKFMTLTKEEYIELYLSKPTFVKNVEKGVYKQSASHPNSIDWSQFVRVKDQLQCAAGWAFSITNQIEAYYHKEFYSVWEVSVQQEIDCATPKKGCQGDESRLDAINYVINNGYELAENYDYVGYQQTCKKEGGWLDISNYTVLTNIEDVRSNLAFQALSVQVDASNWQFYWKGIFSSCSSDYYNHHALLVGYDQNQNWKIQNSFGISWGESGHIRLAPGNTCGLANQAYKIFGSLDLSDSY